MLVFLFLLGLALCAVSPSEEQEVEPWKNNCPMSWSFYNGRSYLYVSTHLTWADAELHCVSLGANLVSIHSKEEHLLVRSLIKNFDPAEGYTWIGLNDIYKEGRCMWSDGCAAKFFYWHSGQPDNNRGNEDCGHTNFHQKWNDRPCSATSPSVCASRITCV
ncbi:lactose-binding lectin l-2-like [Trematomus bernacchii]|uniref:lactose-binding lectin l-2-like n=1 Tax=Trematomus bernacchii TaxID=40690 RepID=UPI00146BE04E|nr:lactose-binding lectin l-2-like [Trematomus bernacchii]